jgi:hypothetical protein
MRLITGFAVCLVCVMTPTRSAEAGPIHTPDATTRGYFERHAGWLPLSDRDAHALPFRDQLDWLSRHAVKTGKPYGRFADLIDWAEFLGQAGPTPISPAWHPPVKPEKDEPAGVPEPATLLLFGIGAVAFARAGRRSPRRPPTM